MSAEPQPDAADRQCHALSGLILFLDVTQGVALGWYVAPLRGFGASGFGDGRYTLLREIKSSGREV